MTLSLSRSSPLNSAHTLTHNAPIDRYQKIDEIISDPSLNDSEKAHFLNRLITQLNPKRRKELLFNFLEKPNKELLEFLSLLRSEAKELLFQSFVNSPEEEFTSFFTSLISHIIQKPLEVKNNKKLAFYCLQTIPLLELKILSTHLYHHLDPDIFYPFLCLLYDNKLIKAFLEPILSVKPSTLARAYQNLLEKLSKHISKQETSMPVVLHQLLQFKTEDLEANTWQHKLLIDNHFELSTHTLSCITWCADIFLRKMIAKQHSTPISIFATLLQSTLDIEPHFGRKIKLFNDMIIDLNYDQIDELIGVLQRRSSDLLAYLPCALSNHAFEELFFPFEYNENEVGFDEEEIEAKELTFSPSACRVTTILDSCPIKRNIPLKSIAQKLNNQKRLQRLLNERLIRLTQSNGEEILLTVNRLKNKISPYIGQPEDFLNGYSSELMNIPPYLLALSMYRPDEETSEMSYEMFIDGCMSQWTERQLHAIGIIISPNSFEKRMKTMPMQAPVILETMGEHELTQVCANLMPGMENGLNQMRRRFNALNIHLESLLELTSKGLHQKELRKEQYEYAAQEVKTLNLASIRLSNSTYKSLENEVSNLVPSKTNKETFDSYLKMRQDIRQLQDSITKNSFPAILKLLGERIPKGDESKENLFDDFPDDFICLLTQGMINNLDLQHPNGNCLDMLAEMGIKNIDDLKLLGYSKKQENAARLMRTHILDACLLAEHLKLAKQSDNLEKQDLNNRENLMKFLNSNAYANAEYSYSMKPEQAWNKLYYSSQFSKGVQTFLDEFDLLELPVHILIKLTQTLIQDYEKLETIDPKIQDTLNIYKAKLNHVESSSEKLSPQEFKELGGECIKAALHSFYIKEITVLLKQYLDQCENREKLKDIWKKLNKSGISSLSDLKNKMGFTLHDLHHLADRPQIFA